MSKPFKIIDRQYRKRGDTYSLKSPIIPYRIIFTKNPDLVRYILQKKHKNYEKSEYQTEKLGKFLGKGLLTNYGKNWRKQRRLIQPGFNYKKIESLKNLVLDEIQRYFHEIPKDLKKDFYPYFNQLTFNIVAKSLFSSDVSNEDLDIISKVLTKTQEFYIKETFHPFIEWYLKKTGKTQKVVNEVEAVRKIIQKLIDDRREGDSKDDLLDMLLNVRYEDTNELMTDKQLIDEILILLIAGHETTANALSFVFYVLGQTKSEVNLLEEELKNLGDAIYDIETLFKPSVTQNIIKETMRLYPPAWVIDRQALVDDSFGNFSWPKNTVILGNLYAMNRDEKNWKNATEFNSNRFFNELNIKEKVFFPFGGGPRHCIGEHFAMMEMILVLRYVFSNYNFELIEKDILLKPMVTLRPDKIVGVLKKL